MILPMILLSRLVLVAAVLVELELTHGLLLSTRSNSCTKDNKIVIVVLRKRQSRLWQASKIVKGIACVH